MNPNPRSRNHPFLEVRHLSISIGRRQLVRDLYFTAHRGKVTGLVGESGSGKSLTCQTVMGLLPSGLAASGSVVMGGKPLPISSRGSAATRRLRSTMAAMILQNPSSCFNPVLTIRTHFKETLAAHGIAGRGNTTQRWQEALAEVGFPEPEAILPLYPFQMSGGMLQRVMIALALALNVEFLIADEATTDLDAVSQANILLLLENLVRAKNLGILLVTHDLSVIARLADEVIVMRHGEIVERNEVRTIFHAPHHPYTIALLKAHFRLYSIEMPAKDEV